ncbi:MAG: hypothetical protein IPJ61_17695 [Tessaracoccus sp.]|uniref:hypothetical protein n=1 Tax=Tessaracoccus sp. TaxID=1971211 RepID=UPI001EB38555|nr:hypothetical protein [Tessaracoccus sp.]MBK7822838.1 hypothetical protein [Tessaracoccus sp.]
MAENVPNFDNRPGIFLAHEMPENLKIAPLSDAAFRTLVKAWCYCSRVRSDGRIPSSAWATLGPAKARKELLAPPIMDPSKAPLFTAVDGGVMAHDYLQHNRSADEVKAVVAARADAGSYGSHVRWHVARRQPKADCEHCQEEGLTPHAA